MSFSDFDMYQPNLVPPLIAIESEVEKSGFEAVFHWIEALFKDFLAFLDDLFTSHDEEWTRMPDSQFNSVLQKIRIRNLRNGFLPEHLVTGERDISSLTEGEKKALLERIEMMKRDFYHKCLDDVSLLPSYLDGNTATDSLMGFLFDLYAFKRLHPDDPYIDSMIATFAETYKFAVEREAVSRLINKKEQAFRKQEYLQKLQNRLSSMKEGERFVYQTTVSHHAVLFEFKVRIVNGKRLLDTKLINSGDGIDHHKSKSTLAFLNPHAKYQTYLVEGADLELTLQSTFLEDLVENSVPGEAKGSHLLIFGPVIKLFTDLIHEFNGVNKVYKLIKVHLIQESKGEAVISDDPRLHHLPQSKGVCSRKIYEFWMQENLEDDLDFGFFQAETMQCAIDRLKTAEYLESKVFGSFAKVDSLKDRLFVQPHWLSKGIASLRGDLKTRTMVLIGEDLLKAQEERIRESVERKVQSLPTLPQLSDFDSFSFRFKRSHN